MVHLSVETLVALIFHVTLCGVGGKKGEIKLKTRQVSSVLTYLNCNLVHWDSFETLGSIYKAV